MLWILWTSGNRTKEDDNSMSTSDNSESIGDVHPDPLLNDHCPQLVKYDIWHFHDPSRIIEVGDGILMVAITGKAHTEYYSWDWKPGICILEKPNGLPGRHCWLKSLNGLTSICRELVPVELLLS